MPPSRSISPSAFFPGSDPVVQQLNAAILFAFGFIVRPIGGWLFGHLADQYGRRNALMLSVLLMCFGSLMIAVTPTYASIGVGAPILLGAARMIQGLSLGGEYGTSATYLTEVADEKHRGFYSSFQYVTLIGGQLCAILVLLLLQQVFLTAGSTQGVGLAHSLRHRRAARDRRAADAPQPARDRRLHRREESRGRRGRARSRRSRNTRARCCVVVGLTMGGTTAFYTYTTYMQKFLKLSVGLNDAQTTLVTAASLDLRALSCSRSTARSRIRIGRKPLLIWFGVMGTLCTIPLLRTLQAHTAARCVALLLIAGGLADRRRIHLDQCGGEGGAVPDESARDRCRRAVRRHRVGVRRHGGVDRLVVQVDRPRGVVLLLPHGGDCDILAGLRLDARYEASVGDGPARVARRGSRRVSGRRTS